MTKTKKADNCDFCCPITGINFSKIARCKIYVLETYGAPLTDLLMRLWLAWAFWKSGVLKFQSFDTTLTLFEYEFTMPPFLSPTVGAYAATGVELIAPILLFFGFGARIGAFLLLATTAMIQFYSYPGFAEQLESMNYWSALSNSFVNPGTESQIHYMWMLLAAAIMVRGPGKWSVDAYLRKRFLGSCCPSQLKK